MFCYTSIAVLLHFLSLTFALNDFTEICQGEINGTTVANPYDCKTFITCDEVPELHTCLNDLVYDAARKVCNWPKFAKCELPHSAEKSLLADINMLPQFIAIDTDTGKSTNPLNKYDPKKVECRHFGAYFLPHPDNCRKYYLCAYGHLHQHHCGSGAFWNYKKAECQVVVNDVVQCYGQSTLNKDDATIPIPYNYHDSTAIEATISYPIHTTATAAGTAEFGPSFISGKPLLSQFTQQTIHVTPPEGGAAATSPAATSSKTAPTRLTTDYSITGETASSTTARVSTATTPHATSTTTPRASTTMYPTSTPTPRATKTTTPHATSTTTSQVTSSSIYYSTTRSTTLAPSTTFTTKKPTTVLTTSSQTNEKIVDETSPRAIPNCPADRQMYLPYIDDCSKYYICILGQPVLTSCPNGLLWDSKAEFCDLARDVQCN